MDYEFPRQLFPSFYNCGPPDSTAGTSSGGDWGSYSRVRPQSSSGPLSSWTFTSSHRVRGETWRHTEPVPLPLLSPKNAYLWPSEPPDPNDFAEHMQNFFMDHSQDAFGCMSEILGENFTFKQGLTKKKRGSSVSMWKLKNYLELLKLKTCYRTYFSRTLDQYSCLLSDVVPSVPTELLSSLLYEELTEQRDRQLFSEATTGGALDFIPLSESSSSGCLLYPSHQGLDRLNFHRVELQHHTGSSPVLNASSSPLSFQLKAPIRQISSGSLLNNCCVAVRSDHLCGVWGFTETDEPRALQVISTKEVATCVSVSPHVLGEVLVASESGVVSLWTVGQGMQKVREEASNLYFNARSSWRWCQFSAHPRVMLYVDRTGVELTDMRTSPVSGHTLFRISNTSQCRSGERLILARYLGDAHPFHHLISTQYSAYIMDERFPCVPMLKRDHMMESPPLFCCVLPGSTSSGAALGGARTMKVLLGSQSSQEVHLLQYSGGRSEACCSQGPIQGLLRPRDSLKHLPVQIPHRLHTARNRLSSFSAGLTCFQMKGAKVAGGEECICVLQLTEAGDVFYQILEPEQAERDTSRTSAPEDEPPPQDTAGSLRTPAATAPERKPAEQLAPDPQLDVEDTWSDDGIIGPTQDPAVPRFVAETPEREQPAMFSDSDDSDTEGRGWKLRHSGLQVIVNDEPELDRMSESDAGEQGGQVERGEDAAAEEPSSVEETEVKLSDGALVTWKLWLQKLMQKSSEKKGGCCLKHLSVSTKGFLHLPDADTRDSTEEERVRSLRRDLRAWMSERSLLVHGTTSTCLRTPDVESLPNPVDTEAWRDQLSQRLTQSWRGKSAWRAWWEEELGLNREEKVKALKRKRRREKQAKRASGPGLELSGSFTSSASHLSDLDSFSDSAGWSSAASQAWSDAEGSGPVSQLRSFLELETPRAATPPALEDDTPVSTVMATPRNVNNRQADQATPGSTSMLPLSQTVKPDSTPASQRRLRKPEDPLRSVFAPQDEPVREENNPPPPASLPSSSSQHHSSQPGPLRTLQVDLSQDFIAWSRFSQSPSVSQSSQGRLGSSQASQTKKRSRMGF